MQFSTVIGQFFYWLRLLYVFVCVMGFTRFVRVACPNMLLLALFIGCVPKLTASAENL